MKKVILISIDGMRPDGLLRCGNPFTEELMKLGSYTLNARTILPSVTLPCHMSMFHSVTAERHGITTNLYTPMVRPVNGIFEQVKNAGGSTAMFFGWHPIRDIALPGSLTVAEYINAYAAENTDGILTDKALRVADELEPDFIFLYMVETDEKGGHDNGWMSPGYLSVLNNAIDNVKRVYEKLGDKYTIIVTADHGGHDRAHGTDMPEDTTIPMFFIGEDFEVGKELENITILDIAPTVTSVMGIAPAREWEGKCVNGK